MTLKKLLSSKIPNEIAVDEQRGILRIGYSKRIHELIPLDSLAYSHSDTTKNHVSMTFYKTFQGTRGQQVYNEVVQVIGMKWTLSWRAEHLKELINFLETLGVEKKVSSNENMSLGDKIISN